jgi:DNA-binding MarR family transcriptional regulator
MTFTSQPGEAHPNSEDTRRDGSRMRHRHRGHGHDNGRPESFSDEPVGTTPEALHEAFFGVGRLLRGRGRYPAARPRRDGLTFARGALLATLETDGPQRMGHLAHRLGVVPRTITPMVDALEDAGLVVRADDPDDRRATILHITDEGLAELTRSRSDRRSTVDEVFEVLNETERTALAGVLQKLRTAARAGLDRGQDPTTADAATTPGADAELDPEARRHRRGRGRGPREGRQRRRDGWQPKLARDGWQPNRARRGDIG